MTIDLRAYANSLLASAAKAQPDPAEAGLSLTEICLRRRAWDEWNSAMDPGSDRVKLWLEDYLADTPDEAKAIVLAAIRFALTPGLNGSCVTNAVLDLGELYVSQRSFSTSEQYSMFEARDPE